ncbi:hypothetical protein [Erythrobacter aureus]|uniref:Uncharacterized protein n=1 Tax=Erythrobacter aureus TaxID=2182384 RepID=A0A345YJ90_9SPHN|nr:hypothetical protein [Erythrobacter aureus]AXK43992.1 hypothetical protein DVR09_16185 [Erythrobacter aureus]
MKLLITLNVIDEALLRDVASNRMANSGFESEPELHRGKPLHDLAFEALYGSNDDMASPDEFGIEIQDWTDAGSFGDIVKLLIDVQIDDEELLRDEAVERMRASGFAESEEQLRTEPLYELVYQTLIGSNPDELSPIQMGIEIGSWTEIQPTPTEALEEALS